MKTVKRSDLNKLDPVVTCKYFAAQGNLRLRNAWQGVVHGRVDRTDTETQTANAMGYSIIIEDAPEVAEQLDLKWKKEVLHATPI